jgi:hypothetical protein
MPAPARETPYPVDELSVPLLLTVQTDPDAPSMASAPPAVEMTAPVLVIVSGLIVPLRTIGPTVLELMIATACFRLNLSLNLDN